MDSGINNIGTGITAVFAVSGSVVFLAMQAHNRLLSNFIHKMETQLFQHSTGVTKNEPKTKRVRFADDVMISTADEYKGRRYMSKPAVRGRNIVDEHMEGMPQNWQAMYKGILKSRSVRGYN